MQTGALYKNILSFPIHRNHLQEWNVPFHGLLTSRKLHLWWPPSVISVVAINRVTSYSIAIGHRRSKFCNLMMIFWQLCVFFYRPRNLVVADFGCGDAKIARSVPNKVHSFDLMSINEHVTPCDMAKVSGTISSWTSVDWKTGNFLSLKCLWSVVYLVFQKKFLLKLAEFALPSVTLICSCTVGYFGLLLNLFSCKRWIQQNIYSRLHCSCHSNFYLQSGPKYKATIGFII